VAKANKELMDNINYDPRIDIKFQFAIKEAQLEVNKDCEWKVRVEIQEHPKYYDQQSKQ
jgi:hypothetical protein